MKNIFQIAVDGHSSTGKSTIAKQIAKRFNIVYVDTGAMYRSVTLYAIKNGLIEGNEVAVQLLIEKLAEIHIDLEGDQVFLNQENVSEAIRTMEVSGKVSLVSQIKEVRTFLVAAQQKMGTTKSVVMDGRDIGSVVFPDAKLKLFVTAKPKVRAQRRFEELQGNGQEVKFEEVLQNLEERDHLDSTREESPLVECEDSVFIDNSNLSMAEQLEMISVLIKHRLSLC
ncbi:MAG: (d)CMP kinase [Flavobacteriales bacterium]|jgi:cytidylate kinase|nr:(d)CMP kinase [Flavobacteriales bacterium]